MCIYFVGADDVMIDWIQVYSELGMYECAYTEVMNSNSDQIGQNCTFIPSNY